ncbi:hypothetical protein CYY_006043 [Polysphondylium violaceum]|uniref:Actin binding protein n=1 Tax=Polysphondylium violaceum TaxID=133409 RepID=A0A8J4Q186_9MYCE|nr:hypothetical protein CYY_006043 [Polysphondylium violaceum]
MRLFARKKKDKDGNDSKETSENEFLSSLPAKANKRYSMAYSSFSPPGTTSNSFKSMNPDSYSPSLTGLKIDDKGKAVDTPEFFVNTISVLPNIEILASLCSTLQTKPSSWSKALIEANGIEVLLDVLVHIEKGGQKDSDIILQSLTVTCLLSLLNSKFGIEKAITTPSSMNKLILCMDTGKVDTRSSVFEILTAVCLISEKGYQLVLDAMTHFKQSRKEKFRFTFLVESMKKLADDKEYLTTCLALINGLVNSSDEIDERVQLRTEFSRLGLDNIIKENKKIPYEECPDLLTQIDVYEDEARNDQEELTEQFSDLHFNINDPKEVFTAIMEQVAKRPLHHPFLHILQCLLSLPSDSDAGMLSWYSIEKLVQQISVNKQMIGDNDYSGHAEKIGLEDLLASSAPSVAMQTEYKAALEELQKVKDQLKKANFDLNIANTELSSRSQESTVLKSNMFNTVKLKDQEIQKLKQTVRKMDAAFFQAPTSDEIESSTNSGRGKMDSNFFSPPPATGADKPPVAPSHPPSDKPPLKSALKSDKKVKKEKSEKTKKKKSDKTKATDDESTTVVTDVNSKNSNGTTNGSESSSTAPAPPAPPAPAPPPPPMMGGPPPPPPPMGGPPPPPPMMGGPPPPPMMGGPPPPSGGLFGGGNKPPANAPKFQLVKPTTKVKQLQWTKLPNRKLNDTIFTNLGNIKTDWLNLDEIESLFFSPDAAPKKLDASDKKSTSNTKPGTVTVIDGKKSQNLAIYLSKFKCTIEEMKNGICMLDESLFNIETLKALETYLPTEEDMEAIRDYLKNGELKMLTKAEHFLLDLDSIPNIQERVKAFSLKLCFPDKLKEIKPDLELFTKSIHQLKSSKKFLKVIEVILIIGNFLNGGTARGDCLGFKMDTLLKLTDTKTFNNKSNLLVYIISEIEQKFPECLNFLDDLDLVNEASKISLAQISGELNLLKKDLESVTNGVGKMKQNREDMYFFSSMEDFIKDAGIELKIAQEQYAEAESEFQKLAVWFGEETKIPSEELFSVLTRFLQTFDKSFKDFQRDKESAERAMKRDQMKAQKTAALKKISGKASAGKNSPLNSSTSSMAEGMVDDIMQSVRDGDAFKQRRQKKTTTGPSITVTDSDTTATETNGKESTSSGRRLKRSDKSDKSDKSSSSPKEEDTENKKDVNVAAKALTVVMRARQNYSRIDQFDFDA